MKVAVTSSQVFSVPLQHYGGLEQVAYQCAEGLAKLGHDVTLFAPEGSTTKHAKLHTTGAPGKVDEKAAYSTYWHLLPDYEVVVSHAWNKWEYVLKMEGKLPIPVLGVCHAPVNTMFQTPPPVPKPCIVCISKDQRDHYQALFGKPARYAWNGIDPSFYKSTGVPRSDRFLFLARFSAIKGADIAISACIDAGVGLDLVGDTSITNEPDFLRHCYALAQGRTPTWDVASRGPQIRIHGSATRGECVSWFSQAHAMIHPNERFREPFGLAPLESLACGTEVIAWNFGAMRETIPASYLVDDYQGFVRRIKEVAQTKLSQAEREALRTHASQFSVENSVKMYDELIHDAVQNGGW